MSETFARPLVIGYLAFDRPIGAGGILGNSVPTLQRMERRVAEPPMPAQEQDGTKFGIDDTTSLIREWLKMAGARDRLGAFLQQKGMSPDLIPNVLLGAEFAALRKEIVNAFAIGANCG